MARGDPRRATEELLLFKRREKAPVCNCTSAGVEELLCTFALQHKMDSRIDRRRALQLGEQTDGGVDRGRAVPWAANDREWILRNSVRVVFSPHHRQRDRPTRATRPSSAASGPHAAAAGHLAVPSNYTVAARLTKCLPCLD